MFCILCSKFLLLLQKQLFPHLPFNVYDLFIPVRDYTGLSHLLRRLFLCYLVLMYMFAKLASVPVSNSCPVTGMVFVRQLVFRDLLFVVLLHI